jgi:hypothetical protein
MWHEWGEQKIIHDMEENLIARDHLEEEDVHGR